jgi:hypothetical protein
LRPLNVRCGARVGFRQQRESYRGVPCQGPPCCRDFPRHPGLFAQHLRVVAGELLPHDDQGAHGSRIGSPDCQRLEVGILCASQSVSVQISADRLPVGGFDARNGKEARTCLVRQARRRATAFRRSRHTQVDPGKNEGNNHAHAAE